MNKTYLFLFLVLSIAILLVIAYVFRYEPITNSGVSTYVWDRWTHKICIAMPLNEALICGPEYLDRVTSGKSVTGGKAKKALSRIEQLRAGGFSDKEIYEYIEKEKAGLKSEGASDSEISDYFFLQQRWNK